jgi:hypothetical protein
LLGSYPCWGPTDNRCQCVQASLTSFPPIEPSISHLYGAPSCAIDHDLGPLPQLFNCLGSEVRVPLCKHQAFNKMWSSWPMDYRMQYSTIFFKRVTYASNPDKNLNIHTDFLVVLSKAIDGLSHQALVLMDSMLSSCSVRAGAPTLQLLAIRDLWPHCWRPFAFGT